MGVVWGLSPQTIVQGPPFVWLFNNPPATDALAANGPASAFIKNTTVLLTYSPNNAGHVLPSSWNTVQVGQFGDWTQIPSGTRVPGSAIGAFNYVMYDYENWANTPAAQFDASQGPGPNASAITAAGITHGIGDTFMLAPAANLASVAGNGGFADKFAGYLAIPLTAPANSSEWFCIQSQGLTGSVSSTGLTFFSFVSQAVAQILSLNPSSKIIVGISTQTDTGVLYTEGQIESAISSVSHLPISGFWFNCPPAGGAAATAMVVDVILTKPSRT